MCVRKLCVCVSKLCGEVVCVCVCVCVRKLCVDKLCV